MCKLIQRDLESIQKIHIKLIFNWILPDEDKYAVRMVGPSWDHATFRIKFRFIAAR
jgi:hypothetical protein